MAVEAEEVVARAPWQAVAPADLAVVVAAVAVVAAPSAGLLVFLVASLEALLMYPLHDSVYPGLSPA